MAVEWHGRSNANYGGGVEDNVDLPLPSYISPEVPGAQLGDTLFVVGTAVDNFTVTDGRFQRITVLDQASEGYGEAWVGIASTLDPVSVYYDNRSNHVLGQFTASVIAVRNKWQPDRVATLSGTGGSVTLPALSGTGEGAVLLAVSSGGGGHTWTGASGYLQGNTVGAYFNTTTAYTEADPVSAQASSWTDGSTRWALVVVGLGPTVRVAPPCRLHPRADGLGVGGGRHFPPSKSQQRSGRRFGYY